MPTLSEVVASLEALWPPERAEAWDAVGLVCGDPRAEVSRVLFAVDPVRAVADEAIATGAQLLVTHHPLYLRGTTTVAPRGPAGFKGGVVHDLIRAGVALHVAHTNADRADPGVSDALAAAVGLRVTGPLVPDPDDPTGRRGLGRVGVLEPPLTLGEFADRAARGLPATATGLRVAGDPAATVRTVAVCGGSGDSLFDAVRAAGADAYLTADLRHHPVSEARERAVFEAAGASGGGPGDAAGAGPALVDAAHWATEWPWCGQAAAQLDAIAAREGWALTTSVSTAVTDPWTAHALHPLSTTSSPGAPR